MGCGDDSSRSAIDAGAADAASGDSALPTDGGSTLQSFGSSYIGTYTPTFHFLDTVTLETFSPDPASTVEATVSWTGEDYSEIRVEFADCSGVASFTQFDDSTEERFQRYEFQSTASCSFRINNQVVEYSDVSGPVFWGESRLRAAILATGDITNSVSLMNLVFDSGR